MKKFIRVTFVILLILSSGAMLTWYLFIRRTVPLQAKYIPSNAMAVATFNMRALAIDHASGGHLFPEFEKNEALPGFISTLITAAKNNGGSGLKESADVLAFLYHSGESAFGAVTAVVKDSSVFGKLVRNELSKTLKTSVILSGQKRMIGIKGSQQIVLGWNDEVMFAVFAISDEDSLKVADACVKLLTTTPGSSLLNNENFITHEKCSFDLGLWINTDEVLAFTGGGKMFRNMFYNTKYISIACDLNKGEIAARRTITYKTPVIPTEENTLLSSDENSTTGFVNFPFHFDTEDAIENTFDVFPLDQLPFDDEHDSALAKTMGTGCTVLLHDTFPSHENFISYSYDEDFNQLAVQSSRSVTAFGTTVCIPLKDAKATQQIIDEQMKANSIPSVNGVYTIDENGMEYRLFIADGILYWTNWKNADGKERAIPDNWSGMQMRVKPSPWLRSEKSEMISFIFPDPQKARSILADQLKEIVLTQTVNSGTQGSDEFRLFFNNEKINALIQLSEIGRKLMK